MRRRRRRRRRNEDERKGRKEKERKRKKGRTYIVPCYDAVQKLQPPHYDEEGHEGIDQFRALRGGLPVVGPQVLEDLLGGLRG